MPDVTETRPRIGLILGGGGVVGVAWELGVLAAITTHAGWNPASATVIEHAELTPSSPAVGPSPASPMARSSRPSAPS